MGVGSKGKSEVSGLWWRGPPCFGGAIAIPKKIPTFVNYALKPPFTIYLYDKGETSND